MRQIRRIRRIPDDRGRLCTGKISFFLILLIAIRTLASRRQHQRSLQKSDEASAFFREVAASSGVKYPPNPLHPPSSAPLQLLLPVPSRLPLLVLVQQLSPPAETNVRSFRSIRQFRRIRVRQWQWQL